MAYWACLILIIALLFLGGCSSKPVFLDYLPINSKEDTQEKDKIDEKNKNAQDKAEEEVAKEPPRLGVSKNPGLLALSIRVNPAEPENEAYLEDWRVVLYGIDDEGRRASSLFYGMTDWQGNIIIELPATMFRYPLVIEALNDVMPFECDPTELELRGECPLIEIFIPPYCYDKAIWLMGPVEGAIWKYYRNATMRHGEGWNPSQVDCSTWLDGLAAINSTDIILDELERSSFGEFKPFPLEILKEAFRENQDILVPTRPPFCLAARRHDGGGMRSGEEVKLPYILDDFISPIDAAPGNLNPIKIGTDAVVSKICGVPLTGSLSVNSHVFMPEQSNRLQDRDFIGVISDQKNTSPEIDVSVFNTKLGNGRPLDSDIYNDACALTSVIQFTNTNNDEINLLANATGVTFTNLFGDGANTEIFMTSDGDNIVDDNDFWVIFFREGDEDCKEKVLAVELLGHRREALRDALYMKYETHTEDLFLGLRADYQLNDSFGGETAFLSYTVHLWDGSSSESIRKLKSQFATCYLAADRWALQFFRLSFAEIRGHGFNADVGKFCPLELAEFAVHSQCFSNSRSNQRWQNELAGIESINSIKNVTGNIIINPGWLGPNLDFDVFIQRFNQATFSGPLTLRTTDDVGQMMVEIPTLVEGDRVLMRSQYSSSDDYTLILPCVPEFTGFLRPRGVPYINPTRNRPSIPPLPVDFPKP